MSFDKQNFARTIAEQQAGISPQMWPIKLDPKGLSLNSPWEVDITPCDCIWLPITYDKSYGVGVLQGNLFSANQPGFPDPAIAGWNFVDMTDINSAAPYIQAPIFGLRFNTPNNPWLLWGLGSLQTLWEYGTGSALPSDTGFVPVGSSSVMRSITGPISRLWCQFYRYAHVSGTAFPNDSPVILMSSLGFNHQSVDHTQNQIAGGNTGPRPDSTQITVVSGGAYRTTDLNSADLRVLGANPVTVAPTTAGTGSTTG